MSRVAIVTDSAACIPSDLVRQYSIRVVPFPLIWGDEVLRDGVDISPAEVYRRLRTSPTLPTTSQPNTQDFVQIYEAAAPTADGILSIHIPERLSGTIQSARLAIETNSFPCPIRVIDCGSASAGQGLIVLAAARAAQAGASLEEITRVVEALIPKTVLMASVTDLSYIQRGGRVQAILGIVGSMLKIVPVFSLQQGNIRLSTRARTQAAALGNILDEVARRAGGAAIHAAVLHAAMPDEAAELCSQMARNLNCLELWIGEFTPLMGAHTGPGVIGVAFYPE
jgi:DegV family protein with EDD domain